jgi:cellulase/cellobiase CelA1
MRQRTAMPARFAITGVVAFIVAALGVGLAAPAVSAAPPVRIMPLGDSITAGPGCWRALLWDRLVHNGYTNIDFVGTQPGGGCSVPFDGDSEGHGGFSATGIADQNQLPPWLAATRPDIVVMHLGTNDLWGGTIPTTAILAAYSTLVDQMRASNPSMKILVAQIIPMEPSGCTGCPQGVVALDNAIPGWAAAKTTAQSPITVVDQWTGFNAAVDTNDGVHPVDSGFRKMADRWYPALTAALGDPAPPTTTPPPPGGACTATYRLIGQWSDGLQAEVSVRNNTASTTSAWVATLTFGDGQQITQAWNATLGQSAATATAQNVGWNGTLAPGGSTAFGYLASWSGPGTAPTATCTVS